MATTTGILRHIAAEEMSKEKERQAEERRRAEEERSAHSCCSVSWGCGALPLGALAAPPLPSPHFITAPS